MKISFVETMRGTLELPGGATSRVDFHVRAHSGEGGRFKLTGIAHAPPWVDETTADGTLRITLLPARIEYDVRFRAADGRILRLHGAKRPSPFRPVESMTVLPITLSDEAEVQLAKGTMYFDVLDLPAFLASALPGAPLPQRQLASRRAAVERRELVGEVLGGASR